MRVWQVKERGRSVLFSPVGLRPLDDLTRQSPLGKLQADLEVQESVGVWSKTAINAVFSLGGVIAYPGLGRHSDPLNQPVRHYRVKIQAEFYRPLYSLNADGIEFDAFPYNDTNPPTGGMGMPQDTLLVPAANYPFPPNIAVLRGMVTDSAGVKLESVLVEDAHDRTLTDGRGEFALPMRLAARNTPITITATHLRSGQTGNLQIVIPDDLNSSHTIVIS